MSFGSHEMVVRVAISGDFEPDTLNGWLVAEADRIGVHGWSRARLAGGCVEALFAGDASNVIDMVRLLTDSRQQNNISDMTERPVSGHEPVWHGFHHLPPV